MIRGIRKGFTLVELLVVMAIIGLLVAIAVPGLNLAKFKAKEGVLKAKLNTISTALESFNGDQGFYPASSTSRTSPYGVWDANDDGMVNVNDSGDQDASIVDTGAHLLTRALIGADGLGYQKNGFYRVGNNGQPVDINNNSTVRTNYLDTEGFQIEPLSNTVNPNIEGMDMAEINRQLGLELDTTYKGYGDAAWLNPNSVIRDDLTRYSMPILYYKANKRNYLIAGDNNTGTGIYNYSDNQAFTDPTYMELSAREVLNNFAYYIWDNNTPVITDPASRPCKKDSFILITAGKDGLYGTADDICSFDFKTGK